MNIQQFHTVKLARARTGTGIGTGTGTHPTVRNSGQDHDRRSVTIASMERRETALRRPNDRAAHTAPTCLPSCQYPSAVKMRSAQTDAMIKNKSKARPVTFFGYPRSPISDTGMDTDPDLNYSQLNDHFQLALQQLPDFQLTKQLIVPSYVSPRHQPCIGIGPTLTLAINPIGKPVSDKPLLSQVPKDGDAAPQSRDFNFPRRNKSRYVWIDSIKQWVELDNVLVPYINFIRTMRLCERDILFLEQVISKHGKSTDVCRRFLEHFRHLDERLFPDKVHRHPERQFLDAASINPIAPFIKTAPEPRQLSEEPLMPPKLRHRRVSIVSTSNVKLPERPDADGDGALTKKRPVAEPMLHQRRTIKRDSLQSGSDDFSRHSDSPEGNEEVRRSRKVSDSLPSMRRVNREVSDYGKADDLDQRRSTDDGRLHPQQVRKKVKRRVARKKMAVSPEGIEEGADGGETSESEYESTISEEEDLPKREIDAFMETYLDAIRAMDGDFIGCDRPVYCVVKAVHRETIREYRWRCTELKPTADFDDVLQVTTTLELMAGSAASPLAGSRPDKELDRINTKMLVRNAQREGSNVSLKSRRNQDKQKQPESAFMQVKPRPAKAKSADKSDDEAQPGVEKHVSFEETPDVAPDALQDADGTQEAEVAEPEEEPRHPLLLPKLEAQLSHSRKKRGKPRRDTSLSDELERQRKAELLKQKFRDMLESETNSKLPTPMMGMPDEPIYDDFGWLAKYCIFNSGTLEMYRRAFETLDENGRGWLTPDECMMALRGVNAQLSNSEQRYLYRIIELLGRGRRIGIDFKLFSIISGLSQRLASLDNWMRSLINKTDLAGLEMKISICLKLWENTVDEVTGKLPIEKLCLELKVGGVSPQHEHEVRHRLGWLKALDILDYLTYMPLFIMIHESVLENPLRDERDK